MTTIVRYGLSASRLLEMSIEFPSGVYMMLPELETDRLSDVWFELVIPFDPRVGGDVKICAYLSPSDRDKANRLIEDVTIKFPHSHTDLYNMLEAVCNAESEWGTD